MPPDILDTESSSDVLAREGTDVSMVCKAKGYPTPTLTWRREDHQPVAVGNWQANNMKGNDSYATFFFFEKPFISHSKKCLIDFFSIDE